MRTLLKLVSILALFAAPLLAASLWLDRHGETSTATVTARREEIVVPHEPTGGWTRQRYLEVDFPRLAASGLRVSVKVDSAEYAASPPGSRVAVRYFPCCPIFARLAAHTTREAVWDSLRILGSSPVLDWCLVGVVALLVAARIAIPVVMLAGAAWLGLGLAFLFPVRPPIPPGGAEAAARVGPVVLVDDSPRQTRSSHRRWSHPERLTVSYQVVQLRLLPPGANDTVLAVDEVDAGSVPSLEFGAPVRVRYPAGAPAEARLVQGTRTFRERNRFDLLFLVLGFGGIGVAAALAWRIRRRRRTGTAA